MAEKARRVARVTIEGEVLWLKDFAQPSPSKWAALQKAAFLVTRLDLIRPVPSRGGIEGCELELAAMQRFREAGARVPELRWRKGAAIAITHIGETLRTIEGRSGEAGVQRGAVTAAEELSRLHALGIVHGRPILRNLTWNGETIGFLDFEEQPLSVMSREAAQARDILLLLASIGRRSSQELVTAAYAAYAAAMPRGVDGELLRALRLAPLFKGRLGSRFLARLGSRDVKGLTLALSAIAGRL